MPPRQAGKASFCQLLIDQGSIQRAGYIHSENTIGSQCQVNRAHGRRTAFLITVSNRQQWQKGDSLLNLKFGESVAAESLTWRWLTSRGGSVREPPMHNERYDPR